MAIKMTAINHMSHTDRGNGVKYFLMARSSRFVAGDGSKPSRVMLIASAYLS
jgi:hypothetical protein